MPFEHSPVMPDEVLSSLSINPHGVYVDGTLGGAGHALLIARRLTTGLLVGVDRDGQAIEAARARLGSGAGRCLILRGNFHALPALLAGQGVDKVDGVLLDLGVSSHQLDTPERGFSYRLDARLDMRMDDRDSQTAYDLVNNSPEKQLASWMFAYGEERFAKRIAKAIARARAEKPVETTGELAALVENAVPLKARAGGGHPAKRVFQALRIAVNGELDGLDAALRGIAGLLKPGGRFSVITFHSLEDRIVKQCFASLHNPCVCPRDIPFCVCGKKPSLRPVTRKPITPGETELARNRRAHSAKLRVSEGI